MTNRPVRTRAALALAAVFVAGIVLGAAAAHFQAGRRGPHPSDMSPEEFRAHLLDHLTRDLALDEEQQIQIEAILDEVGERYQAVRDAIEPELEAIRGERADRIMEVLDQEQQAKYESILEERRRRHARRVERQRMRRGRPGDH